MQPSRRGNPIPSNDTNCSPDEASLKSFFLGPQAENADFVKIEVLRLLDDWFHWRKTQFPEDGTAMPDSERQTEEFKARLKYFSLKLHDISSRFYKEIPKFSPRYIGHMFSELSLPAILGHFVSILHNPNNVARESSRVGTEIEREAIQKLTEMFGYPKQSLGHFTSGGSVANYESVVRAKMRWLKRMSTKWDSNLTFVETCHVDHKPIKDSIFSHLSDFEIGKKIEARFAFKYQGPVLIVPESKHYSWSKVSNIFGLGKNAIIQVPLTDKGQMSVSHLMKQIDDCLVSNRPILQIVSVCGTTELGTIDPIEEIQSILDTYRKNHGFDFWHHVDAAYGGFFATLKNSTATRLAHFRKSLNALSKSTSITVDPHKLGYVPYASGVFLCRDENDYILAKEGAPYVDFKNTNDLGLFTIEGSRSAAGAVATKLTADCIGLNEDGYGSILLRTIQSCDLIKQKLLSDGLPVGFINVPTTNILCFSILDQDDASLGAANRMTQLVLADIQQQKEPQFYVSKTVLGTNFKNLVNAFAEENTLKTDAQELVVIRLTIMNPFISTKHSRVNYIQEFSDYIKCVIDRVKQKELNK